MYYDHRTIKEERKMNKLEFLMTYVLENTSEKGAKKAADDAIIAYEIISKESIN